MSDKDFIIETQVRVPDGSIISEKPKYLILLNEEEEKKPKTKSEKKKFICLDLPAMEPAFVKAKGFFCEASESEIIQNYRSICQNVQPDAKMEIYLPWLSISIIKSLVFKSK